MLDFCDEAISYYVREKNWSKLLSLGETLPLDERCKYLWAWPSETDLAYMNEFFTKNGVKNILSIGCGSGLLEWIINESTDLAVTGIEVDEEWWTSKYCPQKFVPLKFIAGKVSGEKLKECVPECNENFALLFCYFNNGDAFKDYVKHFKGNIIAIIGPAEDETSRHTDPKPFSPDFGDESLCWRMIGSREIGSNNDYIVIYSRK